AAKRTQEAFVTWRGEEMAAELGYVDMDVTEGLGGVEKVENSAIVGDFADGFRRLNRTGDIGSVDEGDQSRFGRDGLADRVWVDVPLAIAGHVGRSDTAAGEK